MGRKEIGDLELLNTEAGGSAPPRWDITAPTGNYLNGGGLPARVERVAARSGKIDGN
jgi:hypothetical protein